jgi:hypothetical protein
MLYDRRKDLPVANRTLLQAADIIRERGWCQHVLVDPLSGGFCAEAAIRQAADGTPAKISLKSMPARALLEKRVETIPIWNDAPGRTKEQVIEALEAAAFDDAC